MQYDWNQQREGTVKVGGFALLRHVLLVPVLVWFVIACDAGCCGVCRQDRVLSASVEAQTLEYSEMILQCQHARNKF